MTTERPESPNAEQIRHWNETAGPVWVARRDTLNAELYPLGVAAMERAEMAPGSRVLDVGCGSGDTTIDIARRVGPSGAAVGVDVSLPLLTRALEAAASAGAANASFTLADGQTAALPAGAFDVLFSRFGVMFFSDPEAAFRNLRGALRPGGRLSFICWRDPGENPMMMVPATAVAAVLPLPPMAPDKPGPFGLANGERLRGILERAGFAEVALEKLDRVIPVGPSGDLAEVAAFLVQFGPAAAALRAAGPEKAPAAVAAVKEAIAPYLTDGRVRMPVATWLVTGRAPVRLSDR